MRIGYKLATEGFGPKELIRQAVLAEQAGFDFVEMSDHYHPWVEAQGHSAFTWSLLSAIAMKTERIGLATGVTCPSVRYHPAIIAQAAATMAIVSDGRFTLGVGAGERLNEHVVGEGFPARRARHERFREALEIIRLLWQGGYRSYDGKYLRLEDARVFDLPEVPPVIAVAASGPESARIAAELGDGLFAVEPDGGLVSTWRRLGGHGPAYGEMPLAWAPDEESAVRAVLEKNSFALTGWKVMSELPNPVNFEAATATVTPDQVGEQFACGPDRKRHLQVAQQFVDAGFDHLVALNAGPDPDGFMDFFARELAAPLRALTPSAEALPSPRRAPDLAEGDAVTAPEHSALPLRDYDHLPASAVIQRIRSLTADQLGAVLAYEREHANRLAMVQAMRARLAELADGAAPSGGREQAGPDWPAQAGAGSAVRPETAAPPSGPPPHGNPAQPARPKADRQVP